MQYNCLHFHPTYQLSDASGYLLVKNNLTFIAPLELKGTSGIAIFKITDVSAPSLHPLDNIGQYNSIPTNHGNDIDISFNLNMKHDVFKIKNLDSLHNQNLNARNLKSSINSDSLSAKDIALIRKYSRRFNITNVGNFPAVIEDVTFSNHKKRSKHFSIEKIGNGYELVYEPDFRHSTVTETLLVKTKYSVAEFKVNAYIPLYLIKFIDRNYRLTEVEDSIGNWYYLIILSFVLLTLLLLGTEIVEYIIFLKQKNINYSLLTEVSILQYNL
jgi:hypothetical protein